MSTITTQNRRSTSDLGLAAHLVSTHGFVLTEITGEYGRREFVFDREIPRELELAFHSSAERRLLDAYRNLKAEAHRP